MLKSFDLVCLDLYAAFRVDSGHPKLRKGSYVNPFGACFELGKGFVHRTRRNHIADPGYFMNP